MVNYRDNLGKLAREVVLRKGIWIIKKRKHFFGLNL
jgi:hypothetical protein